MASTSFSLPNKLFSRQFAAIPPPIALRRSLRVSAAHATAERRTETAASRTASCYDVLGIEVGATCQEIKSAYRKLARTLHPDVAASKSGRGDEAAGEFMRVHAAYATLSDPEKRAAYDDSLSWRRRRPAVASATGYSAAARQGRSWETDQCW